MGNTGRDVDGRQASGNVQKGEHRGLIGTALDSVMTERPFPGAKFEAILLQRDHNVHDADHHQGRKKVLAGAGARVISSLHFLAFQGWALLYITLYHIAWPPAGKEEERSQGCTE